MKLPILIVEDEPMIALGLALAIEDIGGEVIGPVASVAEALAVLATGGIGAAVIDANLEDRDVTPVAMLLMNQAIPFVIHTGTGVPCELATAHPHLPLVPKPTPARQVVDRLLVEIDAATSPQSES